MCHREPSAPMRPRPGNDCGPCAGRTTPTVSSPASQNPPPERTARARETRHLRRRPRTGYSEPMSTTIIHGMCAPGFEAVRDTFASNFADGSEVGASFAATRNGEFVIDLWAGDADAAHTRRWERDTIVNVYSTTKAMTALCAHML